MWFMWILHCSLVGMILTPPPACRPAPSLMEWQQMETEENRKLRVNELQIHATNQFDMSQRSVDVNPKFLFPFVMKF